MQPGVTKDENLRTFCSMNPFLYHFDILAEFKFTNAVRKNTDVPVKKKQTDFSSFVPVTPSCLSLFLAGVSAHWEQVACLLYSPTYTDVSVVGGANLMVCLGSRTQVA